MKKKILIYTIIGCVFDSMELAAIAAGQHAHLPTGAEPRDIAARQAPPPHPPPVGQPAGLHPPRDEQIVARDLHGAMLDENGVAWWQFNDGFWACRRAGDQGWNDYVWPRGMVMVWCLLPAPRIDHQPPLPGYLPPPPRPAAVVPRLQRIGLHPPVDDEILGTSRNGVIEDKHCNSWWRFGDGSWSYHGEYEATWSPYVERH
jgi:hypothetical protein